MQTLPGHMFVIFNPAARLSVYLRTNRAARDKSGNFSFFFFFGFNLCADAHMEHQTGRKLSYVNGGGL